MHIPAHTHTAPLLGAYFAPDAVAYYRAAVPLGAIGGAVAPFWEMETAQMRGAECVVVPRLNAADPTKVRGIIDLLRRDAGRVIVDIDDDIWATPVQHRGPAHLLVGAAHAARSADAITTTNSTLAGRLRRLNRDVRVVPNYVNGEDWPAPAAPPPGPPVIVLAGSSSHAEDWRPAAPALARLRDEGAATLRVCGFLPAYLAPLCDDWRPWAGLSSYPAMLAGATVGLCPLPDSGFNRCKSTIKLFEYSLSGAVVVASPCQYGPILRAAGLDDQIVPDGGDWYAVIRHALTDAPARAATLRSHVLDHHDARRFVALIRAPYGA